MTTALIEVYNVVVIASMYLVDRQENYFIAAKSFWLIEMRFIRIDDCNFAGLHREIASSEFIFHSAGFDDHNCVTAMEMPREHMPDQSSFEELYGRVIGVMNGVVHFCLYRTGLLDLRRFSDILSAGLIRFKGHLHEESLYATGLRACEKLIPVDNTLTDRNLLLVCRPI